MRLILKSSIIVFMCLFYSSIDAIAQETIFEEKTTIYADEFAGGAALHTNGFSLNFRYNRYNGAFNKLSYEFEFASIKHPREIRTVSQLEDDVRGYIFGKLNSFFALRPSIGYHSIFVPKQSIRGVSISRIFHVGPSFGFAKPVYLNIQVIESVGSGFQTVNIVTERYDPSEHDQGDIYGRASFFNGFSEMRLYPGIFTKFAFEFEYSNQKETIKALELGITSDFYFEKVPILAFSENRSWFLNLYVGILFGQKNTK